MYCFYELCRRHKDRHTTVIPVVNNILDPIPDCNAIYFCSVSVTSTLTLAGAMIYFMNLPFSYITIFVWISHVCQ